MYTDVLNDLRKSNNYFNKLLYSDIYTYEKKFIKKKGDSRILTYYNKRKGKKKICKIILNNYYRKIIKKFKINFYLEKWRFYYY